MKKATKFLSRVLAVLLVLQIIGCTSDSNNDEPTPPTPNDYKAIVLSRSEAEIVENNNEFALKFYDAVLNERKYDVSVSPLSMSMFLSILANGAAGETRQEIMEALGFKAAEMDAVNTFNHRLANELTEADNTVDLALANSIWIDKDIKVHESFISDNKAAYGAEIFVTDFADPVSSTDSVNAWCAEKTNGVINPFIEPGNVASSDDNVASYSATYFNGKWSTPFDKAKTKKFTFNNYSIEPAKIDMMNGKIVVSYKEIDGTQVVRLPYGNGAFEMVLFVLEDNGTHNPESFLCKQDAESVNDLILSAQPCSVDLTLPKFKLDFSDAKMIDVLEQLGMKNLRDGDFSAMVEKGNLELTIQQKVAVSVDENGTEAAAVTGNTWVSSPGPDYEPVLETKKIVVDSPFEYLIRETSTKAILFIGSVHNITQ